MKKYSYVTLLTDDSYVYGVTLLVETLRRVDSQYPLHVLITEDVSAPAIEILNQLKVSYELVSKIALPDKIYEYNLTFNPNIAATWKNCWTKFRIFNLTQFDKIVFLDADIAIYQNLDHLFDLAPGTAALDGEYFGLWQGWPHFNAGCMVIEPSEKEFNNILAFANNLDVNNLPKYMIADQEILNLYYKDWPNQKDLHLDKYYNVFAPYVLAEHLEDLKDNVKFIHFVGRKPWVFWAKSPEEQYVEHYYEECKKIVEDKVNILDWEKIWSKVTLTVYGICKDEINNVEKYLKSFSKADYLCLLDTGSTDGTWEYLQKAKYNNLIIKQKEIKPWRFDVARNESMELVPKETVMFFMADLDEVIKENDWVEKVKRAWTPLFSRGRYLYNRDVKENDVVTKAIEEFRIHSRKWNKWINIVHEALINDSGQKQFFIETTTPIDITVWHYSSKRAGTNYVELCEEDLKEYPDDWVMRLQLAIEYEIREDIDKAEQHFQLMISKENTLQAFELARCYFGLGRICLIRQNLESALFYFSEGRIICKNFSDNYFAAAEIYYNNQMFDEAIELCLRAFRCCQQAFWCSVFDVSSFYPYWLLGMSYYYKGDKEKALAYLTISSIKNPTDEAKNLRKEIAMQICGDWRNDLSRSLKT